MGLIFYSLPMSLPIIAILLYISIVDLRFHRIPNLALALLTPFAFIYFVVGDSIWLDQLIWTAFFAVLLLGLWRFCDLGMGDVKLLALLSLLVVPANMASYLTFVSCLSIGILIHLAVSRSVMKAWKSHIPLAPSISFATIFIL